MKATLTIGMVEIDLKMHNLIDEEKGEFSSSSYVAGSNPPRKAKNVQVDPETGEQCAVVKGYLVEGNGGTANLISVSEVKEMIKAKAGDLKGCLSNAMFVPRNTADTFLPSGKVWSVEVAETRADKKKVVAYIMDRMNAHNEILMGKLTYAHGYGLSQVLVALMPTEGGKVMAMGYYFPDDVKPNNVDMSEYSEVQISDREIAILDGLFNGQGNDFSNSVVGELRGIFEMVANGYTPTIVVEKVEAESDLFKALEGVVVA